jgi:cytoskeletal protein CcmA (bactofilin family)
LATPRQPTINLKTGGEGKMGVFSQGKPASDRIAHNGSAAATRQAEERPSTAKNSTDTVSTLAPGLLVTGNIVCDGLVHIFGRVTGDIQAKEIVVGEGAQVEGNITAQEISIQGAFKGTIRGTNVRLKGAASVDGEIFSKSLTVEENVLFEGLSRRLNKPVVLPTSDEALGEKPALALVANSTPTSEILA